MNKFLMLATSCAILGMASLALAEGNSAAGKQKSATCAACHNADGNSTNGEWPKLAGQHPDYTVKQLQNFKAGSNPDAPEPVRINATMNGMAAPLSEQDMEDLAAYFASQQTTHGSADPELVAQGRALYEGGNLATGVSACAACHGPTGAGNPAAKFPALAGQHGQYIENQLKAFRSMQRANDPGQMMRNIAAKMTDQEIKAVASYIQGLQ